MAPKHLGIIHALIVTLQLRALAVRGWSLEEVSRYCGYTRDTLSRAREGITTTCSPEKYLAISRAFDYLLTQEPRIASSARVWRPALAAGWGDAEAELWLLVEGTRWEGTL